MVWIYFKGFGLLFFVLFLCSWIMTQRNAYYGDLTLWVIWYKKVGLSNWYCHALRIHLKNVLFHYYIFLNFNNIYPLFTILISEYWKTFTFILRFNQLPDVPFKIRTKCRLPIIPDATNSNVVVFILCLPGQRDPCQTKLSHPFEKCSPR